MGKWMNRASASRGSILGLQLELEKTNSLLADIRAELVKANASERPQDVPTGTATSGPPATLAYR